MKVVICTVFFYEVVCGQGGIPGIRRGGRMFDGLGIQFHPDESSVRNIFEGSFTEEGTVAGKYIF